MRISVLIPTHNNRSVLADTLAPLLQDDATGEIVVVVDGSSDGSFEWLQSMAAKDARIRPFWTESSGQSLAQQYALEQARYDVVLLIDADVVAQPGLVSGHAAWHRDGVRRLVVGYMPPSIPPRRRTSFVVERYAAQYEAACREFETDASELLLHLWGGNVSVPRASLLEAGGCDGGIGIRYMVDVDLGLRLAPTRVEPVFDRSLLAAHRFERSLPGFLRTANAYGSDLVRLGRVYPGKIFHPPWIGEQRGRYAALLRFCRRRQGRRLILLLGRALMVAAGYLKLWRLEEAAATVVDRVEVQQGMLEALREMEGAGQSEPLNQRLK